MCWLSKYPPIKRSAPTSLIVYKVVAIKLFHLILFKLFIS